VLRAIDKLDKFGIEGVKLLLGAGRWDGGKEGEGDFTPGAELGAWQIETIIRFVSIPRGAAMGEKVADFGKHGGQVRSSPRWFLRTRKHR
jgi:histidyl-tRNA synthetase